MGWERGCLLVYSIASFLLTPARYQSAAFITRMRWLLMGRGYCTNVTSHYPLSGAPHSPKMSFNIYFKRIFAKVFFYVYAAKKCNTRGNASPQFLTLQPPAVKASLANALSLVLPFKTKQNLQIHSNMGRTFSAQTKACYASHRSHLPSPWGRPPSVNGHSQPWRILTAVIK